MVRYGFWPFLKHEKMYWEREKQTNRDNKREKKEDILGFFTVYWYSHQSVHPQIFPSVLIAPLNSWRLFICCRLMQPKSHYVWMDAVPFCRACGQI